MIIEGLISGTCFGYPMKIWIIYDSKFGNNKQVAHSLENLLKQGHDVHVSYAKEISSKNVAAEAPDAFIFGGPRRIGRISSTIKGWVTKFAEILGARAIVLKKVAAWETHLLFKKEDLESPSGLERKIVQANLNVAPKWQELVRQFNAEKALPDILSLQVEAQEGPLEASAQEKITKFVAAFNNL